jgi:hypothetical protein
MVIDARQRQRAQDWLDHSEKDRCPECRDGRYNLTFVTAPDLGLSGPDLQGGMPSLSVTYLACAQVPFYSEAVPGGLTAPPALLW